jgi:two-component system response regulator FixJ
MNGGATISTIHSTLTSLPDSMGHLMATSGAKPEDSVPKVPTVFIVDDDAQVRQAVSLLVRSVGLDCNAYSSVLEFLDDFHPHQPGCLVLDVRLPGMGGLELQSTPRFTGMLPPIIFITAYGEIALASQAIRAGAVDFIQKPFCPQALLERIGEAINLDRQRRHQRAVAEDLRDRVAKLTDREREVMALLIRGESTKSIAQHLSISPKTVDNHRTKILDKMKVDNCTQLANLIDLN